MNLKKFLALMLILTLGVTPLLAKDIRTAVFKVEQMHCENCVNKVRNNMKFEKGMKKIDTDLEEKTVTITYDADKTNIDNIKEGFKKINYEAVFVEETSKDKKKK